MTTRNRSRVKQDQGRVRSAENTSWTVYNRNTIQESCTDWVGPGDNLAFDVTRVTRHGGDLNGRRPGIYWIEWENYPSAHAGNSYPGPNHLSLPSTPSLGALASRTLARTNPSRSSTEYLATLFEAREVPGLMRDTMSYRMKELFKRIPLPVFRALSKAAKLNLLIQFGIMPIISDLDVCFRFTELVDQRVREIERLQTRGLRRTVDLYRESNTRRILNTTVQSYGVLIKTSGRVTTTKSIRGHVRWVVKDNFPLTDAQMRDKARQIVGGFSLDPASLWEAMPWSWLIDYFANINDFVKTRRNLLDAEHTVPRIMTHTRTVANFTGKTAKFSTGDKVIYSPFNTVKEWKKRQIVAASLEAKLGFLSKRQTSILASLSMLRIDPRR